MEAFKIESNIEVFGRRFNISLIALHVSMKTENGIEFHRTLRRTLSLLTLIFILHCASRAWKKAF